MASALFLSSWAVLMGPVPYGTPRHPLSSRRLWDASGPSCRVDPGRGERVTSERAVLIISRSASFDLAGTAAVYDGVFRQHCPYAVFCRRGKCAAPLPVPSQPGAAGPTRDGAGGRAAQGRRSDVRAFSARPPPRFPFPHPSPALAQAKAAVAADSWC